LWVILGNLQVAHSSNIFFDISYPLKFNYVSRNSTPKLIYVLYNEFDTSSYRFINTLVYIPGYIFFTLSKDIFIVKVCVIGFELGIIADIFPVV